MPGRLSIPLLALLLFACGRDVPTLEGVDLEKWKKDKNGCLRSRQLMEPALRSEISKLKGLSEMDMIGLLGRPDQNELYKRNQKFYYYFISPGPGCDTADSVFHKLAVRFNAMGYAQLVSIEQN